MSQVSPVDEASSEDEQADDDFGTFEGVLPVLQSTALANALGIPLNHRDSKMHRDEMAEFLEEIAERRNELGNRGDFRKWYMHAVAER